MAIGDVEKAKMVQALLQKRFPFLNASVLAAVDTACNAGLDEQSEAFAQKVISAMKSADQIGAWANRLPDLDFVIKMVEEGRRYEKELEAHDYQTLRRLFNELKTIRGEKRDRYAFFSHPECTPDFDLWNQKSEWNIEEAVALSLNKEPTVVNTASLLDTPIESPFKKEYAFRLDVLSRRLGQRANGLVPIRKYVELLSQDFSIPENFGLIRPPSQVRSATYEIDAELRSLRDENERLKAEIADLKRQPEEFDKSKSMRKIIYCVAVEKYQYRPGNTSATANIQKCMANVFSGKPEAKILSLNTIKKVLIAAEQAAQDD